MARKYLVPLTTLLAASAIAIGSGASFTSQSVNAASGYTAGSLQMTNSKAGQAVFSQDNLKPGDVVTGTLTITNSGTLPAKMTLTETGSTNTFTAENLQLVVRDTTTGATVYSGRFGDWADGTARPLAALGGGTDWAAGEKHTYEFKASLALATGNEDQTKTASAAFKWDGTQVNDGDVFNQ